MRVFACLLTCSLLLAGCGGAPAEERGNAATDEPGNLVDINQAATEAQGDIDTYAANSLENQPTATANPAPAPAPPPATPAAADDRTPVSEAPFTLDSAQGAADVVQTYYALIEAGKYRRAWGLWSDGGRASGMSPDAFAASFAKYGAYHATIGAPGNIAASAGQRFIDIPVELYGTLKEGDRPFRMVGAVKLHRTADIAGASADDQMWRIKDTSIKPRPASASPAPQPDVAAIVEADYRCDGGTRFHVRFDNRADTAVIAIGERSTVTLKARRAASGIWYAGEGYELRGKGRTATFKQPQAPAITCTSR